MARYNYEDWKFETYFTDNKKKKINIKLAENIERINQCQKRALESTGYVSAENRGQC